MSKQTTPYERALEFIKQMDGEDRRPAWRTDNDILSHALIAFSRQESALPPSPVVQWEYLFRIDPTGVKELNSLGKVGWEVCGTFALNQSVQYIFKRPLKHQ